MKNLIVAIVITFAIGMTTTSCKSEKKEVKKELATEIYQCPMDCEKGKSYSEAGSCPACKMDLKAKKPGEVKEAIETKKVEEDHTGHDH